MQKEIWVPINHGKEVNGNWPIAKGMYEVSSLGNIRRIKTGHIYSQRNGRIYLCWEWPGARNYDSHCSYQVSHIMAVEFLGHKNVYGKKYNLKEIIKEVNK